MNTTVRTVTDKKKTYYVLNDLLTAFSITKGQARKSTSKKMAIKKMHVPTQVGKAIVRVYHNVVTEAVARTIANKYGKKTILFTASPGNQSNLTTEIAKKTSQVERFTKAVKALKSVVAQVVTQTVTGKNTLQLTGKADSVRDGKKQAEARKATRTVVQAYAEKTADSFDITDKEQRSIFYDVAYKTLYKEYKRLTPDHIDLKKRSNLEKAKTGEKKSALQVAEQLGVATELLTLAKSIYTPKN